MRRFNLVILAILTVLVCLQFTRKTAPRNSPAPVLVEEIIEENELPTVKHTKIDGLPRSLFPAMTPTVWAGGPIW